MTRLLSADPMDLWLFATVVSMLWAVVALGPMLILFGQYHIASIIVCAGPLGLTAAAGFGVLLLALLLETWDAL